MRVEASAEESTAARDPPPAKLSRNDTRDRRSAVPAAAVSAAPFPNPKTPPRAAELFATSESAAESEAVAERWNAPPAPAKAALATTRTLVRAADPPSSMAKAPPDCAAELSAAAPPLATRVDPRDTQAAPPLPESVEPRQEEASADDGGGTARLPGPEAPATGAERAPAALFTRVTAESVASAPRPRAAPPPLPCAELPRTRQPSADTVTVPQALTAPPAPYAAFSVKLDPPEMTTALRGKPAPPPPPPPAPAAPALLLLFPLLLFPLLAGGGGAGPAGS